MKFEPRSACYILTHIPTGVYYIGSSRNLQARMQDHKVKLAGNRHYSAPLQEVYTTWDDLDVQVEYCDTPEEALSKEQEKLTRFNEDPLCCNCRLIAIAGPVISAAGRAKLSILKKNRVVSDETRQLMSDRRTGRVVQYSDEGYKNLIDKLSNREFSDTHKQNISAAKRGVKNSAEHVQNMIIASAAISRRVSVDGNEYRSIKFAADSILVSQRTVVRRIEDSRYPDWFYIP